MRHEPGPNLALHCFYMETQNYALGFPWHKLGFERITRARRRVGAGTSISRGHSPTREQEGKRALLCSPRRAFLGCDFAHAAS